MVSTQAHTMRWATPHFTALSRFVAPTPMIAPVMVWVVETGMPARVAAALSPRSALEDLGKEQL